MSREEGHDLPWHTEVCFHVSKVINCNGKEDTRKCTICNKEWKEKCNFDENFS